MRSTADSSTLEGRYKETKDGLLLRGACDTKTMHAKEVFGTWWGRRGRTRSQETSSGGKLVAMPPQGPRPFPTPFEHSLGKEIPCFPKD